MSKDKTYRLSMLSLSDENVMRAVLWDAPLAESAPTVVSDLEVVDVQLSAVDALAIRSWRDFDPNVDDVLMVEDDLGVTLSRACGSWLTGLEGASRKLVGVIDLYAQSE